MQKTTNPTLYIKIGLTVIFTFVAISNIRSTLESRSRLKKIDVYKNELDKIKTETADLSEKIEYAQTENFLQEQALDKFNMVPEPATVIVVEGAKTIEEQKTEEIVEKNTIKPEQKNIEKWRDYLNL